MREPHYQWARRKLKPLAWSFRSEKTNLMEALEEIEARPLAEHLGEYHVPATVAIVSLFAQQGAEAYKIGRAFGESLLDTDLAVKGRYIPIDEKLRCIEFPETISFPVGNAECILCAYVGVTRRNGRREILIACPISDRFGNYQDSFTMQLMYVGVDDDETVEDAAKQRSLVQAGTNPDISLMNYILNCLVYIHSGDPDLRHLRGIGLKPSKNEQKAKVWRKKKSLGEPMIDMINVGFDFKKPVLYSKGSTLVRPHWRWQPYGPGKAKVKRILIDQHTRHYGKHVENGD